ncbi:MAG: hypothetical protein N4A31_01545 [Rickettsiales bacterium]|jgi:hypothetical protein|nr:hypothetical protein [Rickettsiales bacterium]
MNPQDALDLLNQFTKFISSNSDDMQGGAEIAEEIQKTVQSGDVEAINSMANNLQNMVQPFQEGFSETLNDSAVLRGAKKISGKTVDAVFSPAALAGIKIAAGTLLTAAGPIGIGIAAGAAAGEIGAAAYDINQLRVKHDEACHLKEYAEYKKNKDKLINDITLKCQANDPNISNEEVGAILKESGALGKTTKTKQIKDKTPTKTPEEEQESFKEVMAKNLAMNSVAMLGSSNPAMFISMINPVGAAVEIGLTAGRAVAESVGEMNEEEANNKTLDTIEQRRKNGPEYKTYNDLDPESLEYKGNVAKNRLRKIVGAEEQDPTRSEISRKYDLAEAALRERLVAESLYELSQSDDFIHNITTAAKLKRQHSNDISPPVQDPKLQEQREELLKVKSEIAKHGTEPEKALAEYKANIAIISDKLAEADNQMQDIADLSPENQQNLLKDIASLQADLSKNQRSFSQLETALKRKEELKEIDPEYLEKELRETEKEIKSHGDNEKEALTRYTNNISANERRLTQTSKKLQNPDISLSPEEEKALSEEVKSLSTRIFEDKESHTNLKAAINRREQLREALEPIYLEKEQEAYLQEKAFAERIQEKETEKKQKQKELNEVNDKLGQEYNIFQNRIENETDIPVDYFLQEKAIEKVALAKVEEKIERGDPREDTTFYSSHEGEKAAITGRIEENEKLHNKLSPLLKKKRDLEEYLGGLELGINNLRKFKEEARIASPQEATMTALRNQNFEVVGNKLDEAKESGLYTSEQLRSDTYLSMTEDGEQVTKTDYTKWAASSKENIGKALTSRENERTTYKAIQQHEEDFDQHISQQRDRINSSITASKQKNMNSLVEKINEGQNKEEKLISRINKLDRASFELKVNNKSLIKHLEEKEIYPKVLEAAKAKESKYKQEDQEKERQTKINPLVEMVRNEETDPQDIVNKINSLDKETLQIKVDDKSITEFMEAKKMPQKVMQAALDKGAPKLPEKVVTPQKQQPKKVEQKKQVTSSQPAGKKTQKELIEEARQKKREEQKQKQKQNQEKLLNEVVNKINNPKGAITTKSKSKEIAKLIKEMDKQTLQTLVKGKNGNNISLIELIAEKNAGSHAMAAALDSEKRAFTIAQINKAKQKVQKVDKELGIGVTAVKSWKRRKTTEQKLESMKKFFQEQDKNSAPSTPNIKGQLAKGARLI